MKKIIILIAIALISVSATSKSSRILIADETWYQAVGTSGNFKIITSNDSIATYFFKNFQSKFTKSEQVIKEDRHGKYWEYIFHFKLIHKPDVASYIIILNKKK